MAGVEVWLAINKKLSRSASNLDNSRLLCLSEANAINLLVFCKPAKQKGCLIPRLLAFPQA